MDGARGGGGGEARDGRRVSSGGYDATNQIKQLLRIPPDDRNNGRRKEANTQPKQKQDKQAQSSHAFDKPGNTPSKQQSWEANRYQDHRRRVDSPSGGLPRLMNFDPSPNQGYNRGYDNRRMDHYNPPNRNVYNTNNIYHSPHHNQPHYNHHHHHHHRPAAGGGGGGGGGALRDNKDPRLNGPRHHNAPSLNHPIIVGHETESPEFRPSPEVLAELEEQFLFPLRKKSLRFPKAKYFCRLCDYHCDSLMVCKRHITDTRHRKLKEAKDIETTLKNVPPANEVHTAAIEKMIVSVSEEMRAAPEMINMRRKLVSELNDILVERVKGCKLEMVGSSVCGICLKTSDVNIDVTMDDNQNPSAPLLAVREIVGKSDTYINVVDDLASSFPTMSFTHAKTGQRMVVGASSTSSKYTNQLLNDYASIDSRVAVLGVAFRYWAKLCQIDDQTKGTLPSHAFPIMLVHFLQQHQPPVLPVLHLLHPNPDGDVYLRAADVGDKWKTTNADSIGKLWLELFRFYTVGFKASEQVINVRSLQPMSKADKAWSKKVVIEDPFLQKRNLTRTVSGNPVFEYILDRFKISYKYFGIPQLPYGPLFLHITFKEMSTGSKPAESASQKNRKGEILLESIEKAGHSQSEGSSECELERTEDDQDDDDDVEEDDDTTMSGFEADLSTVSPEDTTEDQNDLASSNGLSSQEEEPSETIPSDLTSTLHNVTQSQAAKLMQQVKGEDLIFKFEGRFFTLGVKPPLICGSCQKDGHCKADCREDELPPLKKLPPINNHFLNLLTAIFEQLTRDFEPTVQEIEERDKIVSDLENYICQFFRGVTLKLFGSSANGFGFQRSDLDICLTFEGNPKGQNIDHIKIIEALADKLKRYRQCGHVFAITTAKVPIVKFSIRRAYLEGDLSLYNTLALQNTKLLYTYARIDRRVKCLGYAMKYFAKLCDIGDASRGSLSSYAYILMVLHFLQQCKPPVIPVLQELYDHSKPSPELIIDGWNAWFYDNLDGLKREWKDYGKNKDTVGQLWVSMLRYYTETFNWKAHVVTIRQLRPLCRLQKLWNSKCIAIEDPFDLSHNLGAGLSRKMNTFIMKAFIRGREVFGTAVMGCPPGYRHMVDYLFDSKQLTDGAPPNDRGCRFCGKIGHIQKDCPKKKVNMDKKEKKDKPKDRRDISRLSNAEDEQEDTRKQAEGGTKETPKKPDEERKKKEAESGGARGGTSPSAKTVEDVPTGHCKTEPTTTAALDQSLAAVTNRVKKNEQAKPTTAATPATTTPSNVVSTSHSPGGHTTSQTINTKPGTSNTQLNTVTKGSKSDSEGVPSSDPKSGDKGNVKPSVSVARGQSQQSLSQKPRVRPTEGVGLGSGGAAGVSGVSVPPGFQHKAQSSPAQGVKAGTHAHTANANFTPTPTTASHAPSTQNIHRAPEPKQQQQQIKHIQEQQQLLHSQQQHGQPPRQWFWPNALVPQQVHVNSKDQKQEVDKSRNYPPSSSVSSQANQGHQQQYPYSISPAALFHLASQAPSGQISAMLLPNVTENTTNTPTRPVLPPPTTTSSGGAPPPGFTAPIPINYGQQVDALPMNKLMIGSPVFRPPVTQAEGGQSGTTSSVSQPFLSVSGPMAGVYVSAHHTPQTYADPGLNQQVFDTRHFISQPIAHQTVPQPLPPPQQGVSSVPTIQTAPTNVSLPPPGLAASVPQGIGSSVPPQAVPQASMHQSLQGGVSQVNLSSAMSQTIQPVPIGHPFPAQHTYPQQAYQMAVAAGATSGYYPAEYILSDPAAALQSHSPSAQQQQPQPANIPPELMPEMTFQRPSDVYEHPIQALPQYMSSSVPPPPPQHQSLITASLSQPHHNLPTMPPPPPPPHPATGAPPQPQPQYTQGSLVYIDGDRERNHIIH